jgi:hypothetical protein
MSVASVERPGRLVLVWLACYVVLLGAIVWSLFYARRWALAEMARPDAVGQWQAFREDEKQQAEHPGPVQRRVPKSVEPPALVLMRDYFRVSIAGAVLFSSVLYWIMAWFVTGALGSSSGGKRYG